MPRAEGFVSGQGRGEAAAGAGQHRRPSSGGGEERVAGLGTGAGEGTGAGPFMRFGIVGGIERLEPRLRELAGAYGHEIEFHPGHVSGPASERLRSLVERADLVVIVTDVNSHTAVIQARMLAARAGRPVRIVRRFGVSQLRQLLPAAAVPAAA